MRADVSRFLKRINTAKYKDLEINLAEQLENLKNDASNAGVTIMYSPESFPTDNITNIEAAPEWAFIKAWQEIENVVGDYYAQVSGLSEKRVPFRKAASYLKQKGIIDGEMAMLLDKIQNTRNLIVHSTDSSITRGEALEWLGISRSVRDRLAQKLSD